MWRRLFLVRMKIKTPRVNSTVWRIAARNQGGGVEGIPANDEEKVNDFGRVRKMLVTLGNMIARVGKRVK